MSDDSPQPRINRDTHIASGPHRGKRWEDASAEALQAMIMVGHPDSRRAERELARRRAHDAGVRLTRHAIDNGSLLLAMPWVSDEATGLCTWLEHAAREALDHAERDAAGRYAHPRWGALFEIDTVGGEHVVQDIVAARATPPTDEEDDHEEP